MKLKCDVCGREFPKCEFIEPYVIVIADNFQACQECRDAWAKEVRVEQRLAAVKAKCEEGVRKRRTINEQLLKALYRLGKLTERFERLEQRMDARDKPTESVLTKEFFGGEIAGLSDKMFSGACKWTQDNLSKQNSAYRTLHLKAAMELAQEFFRRRKPTEKKRSGYFKGVAITDLTDKQFVEACEFAQATLHRAMLFEIGRSWKTEPASLLAIQLGATMELAQEFARRRNRTKENTTSEPSNTETEPDTVVHED